MTRDAIAPDRGINYYDVLQVSPTASQEVIHAAYRVLARGFHPDVNPRETAAQHMRQLNAAYKVLGDAGRRAQYDLRRTRLTRASTASVLIPSAGTGIRGRPRPDSPKRIEDERADRRQATPPGPSLLPMPRAGLVLVMIMLLTLAVSAALWLTSAFVEDAPGAAFPEEALAGLSTPLRVGTILEFETHSERRPGAQPFLNHA